MPNARNTQQLIDIKEKVSRAKSAAIVEYSGTTVNDQTELRRKLREAGGELIVTKNTLINLGLGEKEEFKDILHGMNALVVSYDDEVGAVKALFEFHKDKDKLDIKGGVLDGKVLDKAGIEALSNIPGKKELIASVIASLNSPASGMVNVLKASTRDLVYVLKAIEEKKA
ncbi:MAG: 50S ribosomal protein L10 [Pseudomonadales bacterium]|jgi:large subunit ribosomal protein L10|nr:50S ribosomal protein L10 [Pseudomonadales bacterium]